TNESINFGRAEVAWIDQHQRFSSGLVDALFLDTFSLPDDFAADFGKSSFDELAHRMCFPRRQHIIVWIILLHHEPHAFDVVARVTPVPFGVEIAEIKLILHLMMDCRYRAGDFARDESFATDWALMVKEDAVRGMHAVGLAVIYGDPIGVELGDPVRAARVKRR